MTLEEKKNLFRLLNMIISVRKQFKYILVLQWTNKIGDIKILSDGIEGM